MDKWMWIYQNFLTFVIFDLFHFILALSDIPAQCIETFTLCCLSLLAQMALEDLGNVIPATS